MPEFLTDFYTCLYFWKVQAVISSFYLTDRNPKAQTHAYHFCSDWPRTAWIF